MARSSKPVASDDLEMRTYRVIGIQPILGNRPGETFTMHIEPAQEQFLIDIGGIELVVAPGPDTEPQGAQGTEEE